MRVATPAARETPPFRWETVDAPRTVTLPPGLSATDAHSGREVVTNRVRRWVARGWLGLRTAWAVCGVTLALLVALEAAYRIQSGVRKGVASATRPTVPHPYAPQPWWPAYQAELRASFATQWEPYVYWRRQPQVGRYVNVDSAGHRRTAQGVARGGTVRRVFFFGGSTMWGTGARDEMTIPSQVAARLAERGVRDVAITNLGETGYVFTQSLLELALELRRGSRPDVVVFLDGLDDVASAVLDGGAGLPQNEANRVDEYRLGRLLASDNDLRALGMLGLATAARSHLLRRLAALASSAAVSGPPADTLGRDVVDTYASTADLVEALARRYGFCAFYFWQPALHTSLKPLTPYEQALRAGIAADPFQQRLRAVYLAAASAIDSRMAAVAPGRFFNLTRVFDDDTATVFLDDISHTTEQANGKLAATTLGPLLDGLLDARRGRSGQRCPPGQSPRTP